MEFMLACEERRALFTPLRYLVDGVSGRKAEVFLKRIGKRLALKWDKSYSEVMGWLRARIHFKN